MNINYLINEYNQAININTMNIMNINYFINID